MLEAIIISSFFIIVLTCLMQVPIFLWFYRNLVIKKNIDYIYTSFWFFIIQLIISVILIANNDYINLENILGNKVWYNSSIDILFNITVGILVNIFFVGILVVIINKLILKLELWNNFFINFVLLLILISIIPLLFYLYLMFQSNNMVI